MISMYNNYAMHSGVAHDENPPGRGSGRFPWGSGKRPKQKEKAKKTVSVKVKSKDEIKKENAQKAQEVTKASDLMQYTSGLTSAELEEAYRRVQWLTKIEDLSQKEVKSGMQKVDSVMTNVKTITSWGQTAITAYNTLAGVYNVTEEGKKNPWPLININPSGGSKKK